MTTTINSTEKKAGKLGQFISKTLIIGGTSAFVAAAVFIGSGAVNHTTVSNETDTKKVSEQFDAGAGSRLTIGKAESVNLKHTFSYNDNVEKFSMKIYDGSLLMNEGDVGFTQEEELKWYAGSFGKPPTSLKYVFTVNGKKFEKTVKLGSIPDSDDGRYNRTFNVKVSATGVSVK